jgi:hypothetical protein
MVCFPFYKQDRPIIGEINRGHSARSKVPNLPATLELIAGEGPKVSDDRSLLYEGIALASR